MSDDKAAPKYRPPSRNSGIERLEWSFMGVGDSGRASVASMLVRRRRDAPPRRQQPPHLRPPEAVVDQEHHALVSGGADHAARGLHHLLQPRIQVGVVVPGTEQRL